MIDPSALWDCRVPVVRRLGDRVTDRMPVGSSGWIITRTTTCGCVRRRPSPTQPAPDGHGLGDTGVSKSCQVIHVREGSVEGVSTKRKSPRFWVRDGMWECQPPFWTTYVLAFLMYFAFSLHIQPDATNPCPATSFITVGSSRRNHTHDVALSDDVPHPHDFHGRRSPWHATH